MKQSGQKQLKYNQARLAILNLIADSEIKVGERLPPERQLIEKLNCSTITMRHALAALESEGVIEKRHGIGNYLSRNIGNGNFANKILYISMYRKDENPPGLRLDHHQKYLAKRGIGISYLSVHEFGAEIIENAKDCLGIVIHGWLTREFLDQLAILNLPTIIDGYPTVKTNLPFAATDTEAAAYRLTRYFIDSGFRNIAIFPGTEDYRPGWLQLKGYTRAMREAKLACKHLVAPFAKRFSIYNQIAEFMQENHGSIDAVLMEHGTLSQFITWCWEVDYPTKPGIGIYHPPSDYRGYHQSKNMLWADFPEAHLKTTELLLDHIRTGAPMKSLKIQPVLHGIDDDQFEFIC